MNEDSDEQRVALTLQTEYVIRLLEEKKISVSYGGQYLSPKKFRNVLKDDKAEFDVSIHASLHDELRPVIRNAIAHDKYLQTLAANRPEVAPAVGESKPPTSAMLFFNFVLPRKKREYVLGDIEEEYRTKWLPKYGRFWACALVWWDGLRSILSIAVAATIADWIARRLGS